MKSLQKIWLNVYEDGNDVTQNQDASTIESKDGKKFSQEEVNKFVAEEKRKQQETNKRLIDELNVLKTKSNLTEAERTELDERIEALQQTLKTEKELKKSEIEKLQKKYDKDLQTAISDRNVWKSKYTDEIIVRSITDAAVVNDAFSPEQIVALLRPRTQLSEALDGDGKPIGELEPKVTYETLDKDKKPIKLSLSPEEAVKRMSEEDRYFNLFKGKGAGGLGGQNRGGNEGDIIMAEVVKDPKKYQELRKAGKLPHQR